MEKYEEPVMEVVLFETEDIITASNEMPFVPASIAELFGL